MKINTITHKEFKKTDKNDIPRIRHIKNEEHHPFMRDREYLRALNATKIERLLAKPFVASMSLHNEGISEVVRHPSEDVFATSGYDGQIILWNATNKEPIAETNTNFQNRMSFHETGIFVCYKQRIEILRFFENKENLVVNKTAQKPRKGTKQGFDYLEDRNKFSKNFKSTLFCETENFVNCVATNNEEVAVGTAIGVEIFDLENNKPVRKYRGVGVSSLEFSPIIDVLGYSSKCELIFVDHRVDAEFLRMQCGSSNNAIRFSPVDPHVFAVANEDTNVYVFDLRNTSKPSAVFKHHGNAVTSLDFSGDGKIVASGSTDKTLRIFDLEERRCDDVFYNKRMQNVNAVRFGCDSRLVYSGSDDGALRVWRTESSHREGISIRQQKAIDYSEALIKKYKDVEQIKRIRNHRFLPKMLRNKVKRMIEQEEGKKRRMEKKRKEKEND